MKLGEGMASHYDDAFKLYNFIAIINFLMLSKIYRVILFLIAVFFCKHVDSVVSPFKERFSSHKMSY